MIILLESESILIEKLGIFTGGAEKGKIKKLNASIILNLFKSDSAKTNTFAPSISDFHKKSKVSISNSNTL